MANWYANPVLEISGDWKAYDMTTIFINGSEINYWTGSSWVSKPLKDWIASEWERKILKRWSGTEWITV